MLMAVFNLTMKVWPAVLHGNKKQSHYSEFLMIIMKLKLNMWNEDLGYRFGVSESMVLRTIHKWLDLLCRLEVPHSLA